MLTAVPSGQPAWADNQLATRKAFSDKVVSPPIKHQRHALYDKCPEALPRRPMKA